MSAILIWSLDEGYIDGALTCYLDGEAGDWKAKPGVATNRDEVLAARRQPLHLLGQHRWPSTRRSSGACPSWRWWA